MKKWMLPILGGLYCCTYLALTFNGAYKPSAIGIQGNVMEQRWAPLGFYNANAGQNGKLGWNKYMMLIFFPLWELDTQIAHRNE